MYIRRKVFSSYIDEYGDERFFSTNELIDESDYLDELMYSKKDDESHIGRNVAIGAGALGAAGAGIYGARRWGEAWGDEEAAKWANKKLEKATERLEKIKTGKSEDQLRKMVKKALPNATDAQVKAMTKEELLEVIKANDKQKVLKGMERNAKYRGYAKKPWQYIKGKAEAAGRWAKGNPKTAAALGVGTAGLAGAGMYYAGRRDKR